MKIRALYLVLLLAISSTIAAQQAGDTIALNIYESISSPQQQQSWWNKKLLHKGYKGYLEFFTEPYFEENTFLFGASTSHGRQFSSKIFLGAGTSLIFMKYGYIRNTSSYGLTVTIPIIVPFVDFRYTPFTKRITPVLGLKPGYLIFFNALKISPYVGIRWGLCEGFGVNLGVEFPTLISPYDKEEMTAVRLKIGIDF